MSHRTTSNSIFYIDPQSMINLAKYDYYLLENITIPIYYFCSKYYDFEISTKLHYKKVFSYNKKKHNLGKALSYIRSYLIILCHVIWIRPKVVHIQWFRLPLFDYIMVRIIKSLGVKVIYTAHNILPHQGNENKHVKVFYKAYHTFDKIIVHSQSTKEQMIKEFHLIPDKVTVIYHGILPFNIKKEEYYKIEQIYDKKYNLKDKIVFSSLGYQNYYKGSDIIAKVWSETPGLNQNKNCVLLTIGKVNDNSIDLSVLNGLNNVITDFRRIPDEEFIYLLRHTDVYLLPYRSISQSGALMTVLPEHIPVLVTCVGGLAEPLDIAPIGWKLKKLGEDELRNTLLDLLNNPSKIETVKKDIGAWQKVLQHYSWKQISNQTQQLYEMVINKKHNQ